MTAALLFPQSFAWDALVGAFALLMLLLVSGWLYALFPKGVLRDNRDKRDKPSPQARWSDRR